MKISNIVIVDYDASCAAGTGMAALRQAIAQGHSGLCENNIPHSDLSTWIGKLAELDDYSLPSHLSSWESRNNALIHLGLKQGSLLATLDALKGQFGARRIGVVMGSSTSSIDRSEQAYRSLDDGRLRPEYQQESVLNPHSPGLFLAELTGIEGPNVTINTACSSSAKVFATAARWLELGLVDAVIVGGADTLCLSVLHGFHSLQLVSTKPCRPFDAERDGINLGEGAGFAILAKRDTIADHSGIRLCGYGESSDAHHMSHPHPDGLGARLAIEQALTMSSLTPKDIGHINLHGTASQANDHIEGNLIAKMFDDNTLVSSTKGWMGHTLGAAGILEGILAIEAMMTGCVPGTMNLQQVDPDIPLSMSADNVQAELNYVMSNSFGFGGNNACLVFGQA